MKRLAPLAFALAVLPAVCAPLVAHGDTYGVTPGYWEIKTQWLGLVTKTDRYCVAPDRISKFLSGPCNHNYQCSYPTQRVANGQAFFEGDIRGKGEAYHVKGGGTYSATTMSMRMSGSGHWHLLPLVGSAAVEAHFLSPACPAGAKKL